MNELPPHLDALIERARDAHSPTAEDQARVRTALLASLGVSSAAGAALGAGASAHAASAVAPPGTSTLVSASSLKLKLLVAGALLSSSVALNALKHDTAPPSHARPTNTAGETSSANGATRNDSVAEAPAVQTSDAI